MADDLNFLSQPFADFLNGPDLTCVQLAGLRYVGEVYAFLEDRRTAAGKTPPRYAVLVRDLITQQNWPDNIDLVAAGWEPPYAQEEWIRECWAMPQHDLIAHAQSHQAPPVVDQAIAKIHDRDRRTRCQTLGELMQANSENPRTTGFRLYQDLFQVWGLWSGMFVPIAWKPPRDIKRLCDDVRNAS